MGLRTCAPDGTWGECEIDGLRVLPAPPLQQSLALGTPKPCTDNACDPFCQQIVDTTTDLDLPPGLQQTPEGGVTLVPKEGSLNDTTCTGIELTPPSQLLTVSSFAGSSSLTGLQGEYFNQRFGDDPVPAGAVPDLVRIDPSVDFNWAESPGPGIGADGFTVRWTGFIRPTVTGSYQICTTSDDGVRLWLGNGASPLIDNWTDHDNIEDCSAAVTLAAGTLYKLRAELYDSGGYGALHLFWKQGGAAASEMIPSSNLHPPQAQNQINGFIVTPSSAQLTVKPVPAGCFDGTVRAAWTLDRLDRAMVDGNGKVQLFAPLAGDIKVTAYVGQFAASGTVRVKVDVLDSAQAPNDEVVTALQGATSGTDPMAVLYPYVDTVFPLALRAPNIQWDDGGTRAEAVMISLSSPANGSAFSWRKIIPDVTPGRYTVPQEVWSLFEASAKGKAASYSVQRVIGGRARPPVVRPFAFATAPVRGKIYYTQYARDGSTNMMVADPGSTTAATSVFPSDSGGANGRRCPVCHSVSANGSLFATSDRSFGSNGGLSKINADGTLSLLSDYTSATSPYRDGQEDWRGFAWSPLTPDGKFALAANNIWGNSRQKVVGIDEARRVVAIPGTFLSGGTGTGLLAKYYMNTAFSGWDFRRTDPKIDFNWGAGAPGGAVPTSFSVAWTGQIQAYTSETYTFSLQVSGGVRLSIGGNVLIDDLANASNRTYSVTRALTRGEKTAIALQFADTTANASIALRWSTPTIPSSLVPQTQLYPNDGWHGVLATYYDQNDFTAPFTTNRLESNIDANWGTAGPRPMPSADNNNWSATFTGQLQAPATGNMRVCVRADNAVTVTVAGTARINDTGVSDSCSAPFAVTEGTKYDLDVRYRELTGEAYLTLSWDMVSGSTTLFSRETIPSERLTPPAGWTPPTRGLTVSYYDTLDFNATLGTNSSVRASTRIEENADLTWGDHRPEYSSALTDSDTFSSRFTGRLEVPCAGMYEFEVFGDDGGRLWLDDLRVVHLWSYGTQAGALWLDKGMHDLKLEQREDGGSANVNLRWKAQCMDAEAFTPIPTANLYPSGDAGTAGYVLAGGDNGNDRSYFVWQTPTTAAAPPVDVTGDSAGRWGLGASVMMVPSFAPDASKLVFIDGDSAAGNGWRKGLSTFSFDQAGKVFKDRKTIVSTWPAGDALKWPVFESDSRSVIYQTTVPADMCCRKSDWTKYGYMGPTNYFEDPGRLYSVDTQAAAPAPVELARLNQGERALDRNKSYQPTMLPQATAGFRWAVFTSTRPYGNTLNLQGQQDFSNTRNYTYISEYEKLQSMLWVAAIDDTTSAGSDRSHPAFFLPNQNFSQDAATGFLNERAFWVAEGCRPAGTSPASSCDVDEDCCGGSAGTAVCRIDSPVRAPPTRHCFQLPAVGECVMRGGACVANEQCCFGTVCDDGTCVKPPAFAKFAPANFERIYESNCELGKKPDWTMLEYKASVPAAGGKLEFFAESADTLAELHTLPAYPTAVTLDGVADLGMQVPPGDLVNWFTIPLNDRLAAAKVVERKFLKITIRLVPNVAGIAAPVLTDLRQSFSCPPGE